MLCSYILEILCWREVNISSPNIAWAWVGQGTSSNLNTNTEVGKASSLKKIIVSRSHSGTIKEIAKEAFGTDIEIIPAGGAGMYV